MKTKRQFQYIRSFDSVRGFAALIVLLHHITYGLIMGGWIGVDLFFVLSGYLITTLLLSEYKDTSTISLSKFYARRALRLFPALILCVLLANILWPYTANLKGLDPTMATLASLFYFINFITVGGNLGHLWSLSVEEHFYIFWPLIAVLFLFKVPVRRRIVFIVTLLVLISVFRIVAEVYKESAQSGIFIIDPYHFTLCRIDGILYGALLSILLTTPRFRQVAFNPTGNATVQILGILAIFIVILFTLHHTNAIWRNGGFIVTNLLCTIAILLAIKHHDHHLFSNRILTCLGKRSYGIYVFHFPISEAMEGFREHHNATNLIIVTFFRIVFTLVFSDLSFRFLEKPILKYKRKFEVQEVRVQPTLKQSSLSN